MDLLSLQLIRCKSRALPECLRVFLGEAEMHKGSAHPSFSAALQACTSASATHLQGLPRRRSASSARRRIRVLCAHHQSGIEGYNRFSTVNLLHDAMKAARTVSLQRFTGYLRHHRQHRGPHPRQPSAHPLAAPHSASGRQYSSTAGAAAAAGAVRRVVIPLIAGTGAGVSCGTLAYHYGPDSPKSPAVAAVNSAVVAGETAFCTTLTGFDVHMV